MTDTVELVDVGELLNVSAVSLKSLELGPWRLEENPMDMSPIIHGEFSHGSLQATGKARTHQAAGLSEGVSMFDASGLMKLLGMETVEIP
jgi:hypothetical protein